MPTLASTRIHKTLAVIALVVIQIGSLFCCVGMPFLLFVDKRWSWLPQTILLAGLFLSLRATHSMLRLHAWQRWFAWYATAWVLVTLATVGWAYSRWA